MRSTGISRSGPSTTASTAPSSSISAAPSTAASTSPATRPPTRTASAATCSTSCATSRLPLVRYPGGNFVSNYDWLDGIGPRDAAPGPARLCLEDDRDQRGRHRRVHPLVQEGRHRADARRQSRLEGLHRSPRHARILQPPRRQLLERPAPQERREGAARCQGLVPRQRDGRPVADEPPHRLRIRPHRQRGRPRHEGVRPYAGAGRLRLLARQHADLSRLGSGGARPSATTRSTTSRSTPTGTIGTTTT